MFDHRARDQTILEDVIEPHITKEEIKFAKTFFTLFKLAKFIKAGKTKKKNIVSMQKNL